MVVIAITGAAGGCGYEAARQLSAVEEVEKLILTARSRAKADDAVERLVKETGKDKMFFDTVILDVGDVASIKAAVEAFPAFDRLCLNAGGLGTGKMHASGNGMTDAMTINTVGNAMLVDGLLAAGKIPAGSRVVWVGSEVSRSLWSFWPMLPNYCGNFKEKDIDWAIGKDYNGPCSCCPIVRQLGDYKNAKIIGHMHFVNLAKEHPESHWMTVSPGAIGGSFAKDKAHFPVRQLMWCMPGMFRCLCVTHACSPADSLVIGTKRYVDVLTGEPAWPTGSMPQSGYTCCCMWGGRGPMIDNRPHVAYFKDEALCAATSTHVREWAKKWESQAPAQAEMK